MAGFFFFALLAIGIYLIYVHEVWLGIIALAGAVVLMLSDFGRVVGGGTKAVWNGAKADASEEWKGIEENNPKPIDTSVINDVTSKTGEIAGDALYGSKPKYKYVAKKPWAGMEAGIKSFWGMVKKLMQK